MRDAPILETEAAQLCLVKEIAPKSPFLCFNRGSIRYDFRTGAKEIRYIVNKALDGVGRGIKPVGYTYVAKYCSVRDWQVEKHGWNSMVSRKPISQ